MNELSANVTDAPTRSAEATVSAYRVGGLQWPALMDKVGRHSMRYGLVIVIGWIGAMKFTTYEAEGISVFVANSPLMAWVYGIMGPRQFSIVLGLIELAVAAFIAAKPYSPRIAFVGAACAVGMFLTTLSFMVTTPGVFEPAAGGFPALSALPGQFLVKDTALLGGSIWLLADAFEALRGFPSERSAIRIAAPAEGCPADQAN